MKRPDGSATECTRPGLAKGHSTVTHEQIFERSNRPPRGLTKVTIKYSNTRRALRENDLLHNHERLLTLENPTKHSGRKTPHTSISFYSRQKGSRNFWKLNHENVLESRGNPCLLLLTSFLKMTHENANSQRNTKLPLKNYCLAKAWLKYSIVTALANV